MHGPGPEGSVSSILGTQLSRPRGVGRARAPAQSGRCVTCLPLHPGAQFRVGGVSRVCPLVCANVGRPHAVRGSNPCSPSGLHSLSLGLKTLPRSFRGQHGEGSGGDPRPAAPQRHPARSAPPAAGTIRLASCGAGSSFGARIPCHRGCSLPRVTRPRPDWPKTSGGGRDPASLQGQGTGGREPCTREHDPASGRERAAGRASGRRLTAGREPWGPRGWRRGRGGPGEGDGLRDARRFCEMTSPGDGRGRRGTAVTVDLTPLTCAPGQDGEARFVCFAS